MYRRLCLIVGALMVSSLSLAESNAAMQQLTCSATCYYLTAHANDICTSMPSRKSKAKLVCCNSPVAPTCAGQNTDGSCGKWNGTVNPDQHECAQTYVDALNASLSCGCKLP